MTHADDVRRMARMAVLDLTRFCVEVLSRRAAGATDV